MKKKEQNTRVWVRVSGLGLAGVLLLGTGAAATCVVPLPASYDSTEAIAYAAGEEALNATFTSGVFTFQVSKKAENGQAGEVTLTSVAFDTAGAVDIPATVTSPESGATYTVTRIKFEAFIARESITSVSIPVSVTSYQLTNASKYDLGSGGCFIGCSSLANIVVADDNPCMTSDEGVLYAKDSSGNKVAIMAYPQAKSDVSDFVVPDTVHTVVAWAFANNLSLKTVTFSSGLLGDSEAYKTAGSAEASYVGGIGGAAFKGCSSLEQVTFPKDAQLSTNISIGKSAAIGNYAFSDCSSLKSITIPALMSADRKGNAYHSFTDFNPNSNFILGKGTEFLSGFASYWHNAEGPVARSGLGDAVFSGCSSLETIVLRAGNLNGSFAYWTGSSSMFKGCSNLKSLIFEGRQAYWGNTQTSLMNGKFTDLWVDSDDNIIANPAYYLAVDYYATEAQANDADALGSTRLARVEYERGTSTADISSGSADLTSHTAARESYATQDADGTPPDPNEAAQAAGLGEGNWVWKLTGTQQHRSGLTESCKAYLVKADDISAGRLSAAQIDAFYLACDRNLSEGVVADTAFDPARYESDTNYRMTALSGELSPIFYYNQTTGALVGGFTVCAADGTELSADNYTVSYSTYNTETKSFEEADVSDGAGAYLVTITPSVESGYTTSLSEWILVEVLDGTVLERYGDSPSTTSASAHFPYSQTTSLNYSGTPYAVSVSSNDVVGALVASSYAGLVRGAINVSSNDSSTFGFQINTSIYASGEVNNESSGLLFGRSTTTSSKTTETLPADYANKCFKAFEDNQRTTLGVSSTAYPWGNTAVLIPATYVSKFSSASAWAYANKAPIFFTELDGSVSATTLANLKKFDSVVAMGGETEFSADQYTSLESNLGADSALSRLCGDADTSGSFSLAVAQDLVNSGKASWKDVTISDGENPVDSIVALTYTGHESGLTLQAKSTDDAKLLAETLHAHSGSVATLILYGRTQNNATALTSSSWEGNVFTAIWKDDATFEAALAGADGQINKYPDEQDKFDTGSNHDNNNNKGNTDNNNNGDENGNGDNNKGNLTPSNETPSSEPNTSVPGGTPTEPRQSSVLKTPAASSNSNAAASSDGLQDAFADLDEDDEYATATSPALTTTATDDGLSGENSLASQIENAPETPMAARVGFVGTLLGLCAGVVPILRRCK